MTYEEAMHYWLGRVNYEKKPPRAGDLQLGRMRRLLACLDNPHAKLRILHVAGSKGKGSTSALLGSILQAAGFRVGLFTSPHLVAFEERIQIDGQPIDKTELALSLDEIRARTPRELDEELTFFEIGTALGFLHFARRGAQYVVLEVGLGGRFDSTNVCDPVCSIITSISFDHTQVLGDTLAKIAFEKAGIIKSGRPTISGVRDPEARRVIIEISQQRGSPLTQIDEDFRYVHEAGLFDAAHERLPRVAIQTARRAWPMHQLGLIGEHQARNAAVAVAAIECLIGQGAAIGAEAVRSGLVNVRWPARLEIVARRPLVLLDCAHNVASAQALVQSLVASIPLAAPAARRLLIFAGSRDKDLAGMLEVLAKHFDRTYLTSFQSSTRCLPADQLRDLMPGEQRHKCAVIADSLQAWRSARAEAGPTDQIWITGSIFLAGELRPILFEPHGES